MTPASASGRAPSDQRLSAEYVWVERAVLRLLLDWYDEPENPEWDIDVAHAAQRLRLQIDGEET